MYALGYWMAMATLLWRGKVATLQPQRLLSKKTPKHLQAWDLYGLQLEFGRGQEG